MFKTIKHLIAATALIASATTTAETYWFNVAGFTAADGSEQPAFSIPTSGQGACSRAVVQYAKANLVSAISCDVAPLPNAVNLPGYEEKPNIDVAMYDEAFSFDWVLDLKQKRVETL